MASRAMTGPSDAASHSERRRDSDSRVRRGAPENADSSVDAVLSQDTHVHPMTLQGDVPLGIDAGITHAATDTNAARTLDDVRPS